MKDNALMEFILFNYNTDAELVSIIDFDIDSIISAYNNEDFDCEDDEELDESFEDYIMNRIFETIDVIISIDPFNNDPEDFFDLLYNFTLFETLISALEIEELEEIKVYCEEIINNMNKPCITLIKKMINNSEKN